MREDVWDLPEKDPGEAAGSVLQRHVDRQRYF